MNNKKGIMVLKKILAVCFILLSFFVVAKDNSIILKPVEITEEIYQKNLINVPVALTKSYDVMTNNGVMTLNFKNGKKWHIANNVGVPNFDYVQSYEYLGDIVEPNMFVIKVHSYEAINYLLVDKNTGVWTVFDEIPLLSKDKKKAVTLWINVYESTDIPPPYLEVKLFTIIKDRFKLVDSTVFEWDYDYDIQESYWQDNAIYFKTQSISEEPKYKMIKIKPN